LFLRRPKLSRGRGIFDLDIMSESGDEKARKRPKLDQPQGTQPIAFPNLNEVPSASNIPVLDAAHDAIFHRMYLPDVAYSESLRKLFAAQVKSFHRKMALCLHSRVSEMISQDEYRREFVRSLIVEDENSDTIVVRLRPIHLSFQIMQSMNRDRELSEWNVAKGDVRLSVVHKTTLSYRKIDRFVITHNGIDIFNLGLEGDESEVSCDSEAWHAISKRLRAPYDECSCSFILTILARLCSPKQNLLRGLRHSEDWVETGSSDDDFPSYSFFKDAWYPRRDAILRHLCPNYHPEFSGQILPRTLVFIVLGFARECRRTSA
jgi:hypothetical protein